MFVSDVDKGVINRKLYLQKYPHIICVLFGGVHYLPIAAILTRANTPDQVGPWQR